jgi:predicted dehydrogenase
MSDEKRDYALEEKGNQKKIAAPELPYLPQEPRNYAPAIGLIGCGGITEYHLRAYKKAGYRVVALCNRTESKARDRQQEFYPDAEVYTDYHDVLKRDDIEVVDVTPHPLERAPIIEDAIEAGKHVLSQKPFVTDLDVGERLVALAAQKGVKLAVNQNGRWAPHTSYMRHAIAAGMVGDVFSVHCSVHWNHDWIAEASFDDVSNMIFFDFGIHWFDILDCFLPGRQPRSVFASLARSPTQRAREPLLGQALIQYDDAQVSLVFDGVVRLGTRNRSFVAGTGGTLLSMGPSITEQSVTLSTDEGVATPTIEGSWFDQGFHGALSELLCAIEDDREPLHDAKGNLRGLALCFAAVESARRGESVPPGNVRRLSE